MLKQLRKIFFNPQFAARRQFLRSLALFRDLSDRDIGLLSQALHARVYHSGEVLFEEGDIGRALFILESGKVDLVKDDVTIFSVKPGDFFGEMALLEQLPRTAKAVAAERSQLLLLYRSKLDSLLHAHPRIGVVIMAHLAQLLSARLRRRSSEPENVAPNA